MDLSIIIVSWNTLEMTRDCLATVAPGHGDLKVELFVVDNASTDGSADMVQAEFPDVHLIRNANNRGFAAANNQAFARASGRHILLLNSDTLLHGDVLSASVSWLDAHPKAGAMGCRVVNADGSTQLTCSRFPSFLNLLLQTLGLDRFAGGPAFLLRYRMQDWDRDEQRNVEVISGCYLLVRREVLSEVGYLDEAFFCYGEETDWCRRITNAGWELSFAPVGTITHFGSGATRSLNHRRDMLLTEGVVRLHRKHGGFAAGLSVWMLLFVFNLSRALFWSGGQLFGREAWRDRARHFRRISREYRRTWPGTETSS